jgi:hypothetical protein
MSTIEPITVAQYLRMSTEHQQYSLENQAGVIQRYAEIKSFSVIKDLLRRREKWFGAETPTGPSPTPTRRCRRRRDPSSHSGVRHQPLGVVSKTQTSLRATRSFASPQASRSTTALNPSETTEACPA